MAFPTCKKDLSNNTSALISGRHSHSTEKMPSYLIVNVKEVWDPLLVYSKLCLQIQ